MEIGEKRRVARVIQRLPTGRQAKGSRVRADFFPGPKGPGFHPKTANPRKLHALKGASGHAECSSDPATTRSFGD